MGAETHIQWTDATVNFWMGCKKVSPGCKFCYMYRDMAHYGRDPHAIVRCKDATFYQAMKWKKARKIFTCSWSDFFVEQADGWRADAWKVIRDTPQHIWQILTKRPERIKDHLPTDWGDGYPNVWLGASVESQEYAEKRIPELIGIPAIVRFLSCEPLLGPLDLTNYFEVCSCCGVSANSLDSSWRFNGICYEHKCPDNHPQSGYFNTYAGVNWVISGGESGPNARPWGKEQAFVIAK
jgi:protein gp37